jgi:hypothetical protein
MNYEPTIKLGGIRALLALAELLIAIGMILLVLAAFLPGQMLRDRAISKRKAPSTKSGFPTPLIFADQAVKMIRQRKCG